jgi:hypothetical protein
MIVTADAGILARATSRSDGPARRLIELIASDPSHQLVLSPYILGEVGKTLACCANRNRLWVSRNSS